MSTCGIGRAPPEPWLVTKIQMLGREFIRAGAAILNRDVKRVFHTTQRVYVQGSHPSKGVILVGDREIRLAADRSPARIKFSPYQLHRWVKVAGWNTSAHAHSATPELLQLLNSLYCPYRCTRLIISGA
jgi:hypothetical protein